mmetsp:Transcript_1040/g.2256  ORF Transcript_1040/g.2256 Transcript_1040/m.2256 type:complete len:251 (-) Transcript_1040:289-1041(-)
MPAATFNEIKSPRFIPESTKESGKYCVGYGPFQYTSSRDCHDDDKSPGSEIVADAADKSFVVLPVKRLNLNTYSSTFDDDDDDGDDDPPFPSPSPPSVRSPPPPPPPSTTFSSRMLMICPLTIKLNFPCRKSSRVCLGDCGNFTSTFCFNSFSTKSSTMAWICFNVESESTVDWTVVVNFSTLFRSLDGPMPLPPLPPPPPPSTNTVLTNRLPYGKTDLRTILKSFVGSEVIQSDSITVAPVEISTTCWF